MKMRFTLGPACCLKVRGSAGLHGGLRLAGANPMWVPESEGLAAEAARETVRKHFPETWIWDLVPLE